MLNTDWYNVLIGEFQKEYFINLGRRLDYEYEMYSVLPKREDIYKAFELTHFRNVKCVILGQDPYPNREDAMGLAFSAGRMTGSLRSIFKELEYEYGYVPRTNPNLTGWAEQGVLLLNTVLTVREGQPKSHSQIGWQYFTDAVIEVLNRKIKPVVFILWGNDAKQKRNLITQPRHLIIEGVHPSPLSANRGFFYGEYFTKANDFLRKNGIKEIDWRL